MGRKPLVSIVTTCFNAEKTIERAIKSVIDQYYNNIEYIIIDACSTDGTKKIIQKYKNHINYFISEKDNGISDGWNKGIERCKGEFIQILNSDDYIPKNKIIESINCFNKNSNASYVFGDLIMVNDNSDPLYRIKGDENYSREIEYWTPRINHPTLMVKKAIYDKYGHFNKKYKIAMDYEWLLRIHKQGAIGYYSEKIISFMQEGGQSEKLISAINEEYNIAVKYGKPKIIIISIQIIRYIKTNVRKLIETLFHFKYKKLYRNGIEEIDRNIII
tara:strand:- start:1766 stop:2587 length:822 start_codon:yes stop_codon:yes gene_type:complete